MDAQSYTAGVVLVPQHALEFSFQQSRGCKNGVPVFELAEFRRVECFRCLSKAPSARSVGSPWFGPEL